MQLPRPWKQGRWVGRVGGFARSATGRSKGLGFLVLLVGLLVVVNGLNVLNSYVGRDFMTAIENKDLAAFHREALKYLGVFGLLTAAAVTISWSEQRLGLLWRDWQTRRLIGRWLDQRAYYQIEAGGTLQNADQRISEDVRAFTATTLSFFLMGLNALFTILAFSGVLWSIDPPLFGVAVGYAALGTALTVLLGRALAGLNVKQADREADFRSALLQVREDAEVLALLHREERQREALVTRLAALVENARRIISVNRNVGFLTTGYNWLIQIIPALLVAPMFIRGEVEFGVITQAAMAFSTLMGAFSLIVTQFGAISSYASTCRRLDALEAEVQAARAAPTSPLAFAESPDRVAAEALTLEAPDGTPWVRDLSVRLGPGQRLLVVGGPVAARAALFRALSGLACRGRGRVTRPDPLGALSLPERPFLPETTLRDLLTEQAVACPTDPATLSAVLEALGLGEAVAEAGGLEVARDWDRVLGRDQRALLAVARAVVARPRFVFLDRALDGVEPACAVAAVGLFRERGIGLVWMGGPGDEPLGFDRVLTLKGDGAWTLGGASAA